VIERRRHDRADGGIGGGPETASAMRARLRRFWCWVVHRRDWAVGVSGIRVCNRCDEEW
jgi:hypothetical protein